MWIVCLSAASVPSIQFYLKIEISPIWPIYGRNPLQFSNKIEWFWSMEEKYPNKQTPLSTVQSPTVEMASSLYATASPQASFTAPPPVLRSASSLYAVASTGEEDHSRCGSECSLNQVERASKKQPKAYKKTFRMYDGWDETAKRVSTAVVLSEDGSILQVFPEKRWFASLIAWRSTFPHAWETRIHLSSELAALYGGKRELAMAPLSVEDVAEDEEAPAYDQIGDYKVGAAGDLEEDDGHPDDGSYDDDERRENGYDADEGVDEGVEPLAVIRRAAAEMGFELVSKVQMAIIRDLLKELA